MDTEVLLFPWTLVPQYWAEARDIYGSSIRWLKPTASQSSDYLLKPTAKDSLIQLAKANGNAFFNPVG